MAIKRKHRTLPIEPIIVQPTERQLLREAMERAERAEGRATAAVIAAEEATAAGISRGQDRVDRAEAYAERAVHEAEKAVERAVDHMAKQIDLAQREAEKAVEHAEHAVAKTQ
jgi:hypothetical protein